MAKTKEITRLHVVTDSENYYDNIGDIDGGMFNEEWLENHINNFGSKGLLHKLSSMINQVIITEKRVLNPRDNSFVISNPNYNPSSIEGKYDINDSITNQKHIFEVKDIGDISNV